MTTKTATIALAGIVALVLTACAAPTTTTPDGATEGLLHFDGYDVTREGLTAYLHDSLFAGEDPDQVRLFCNTISQPGFEPRHGDVDVLLWQVEEEEAPGTLAKYDVVLVPGQVGDLAYAHSLPFELTLAECGGYK